MVTIVSTQVAGTAITAGALLVRPTGAIIASVSGPALAMADDTVVINHGLIHADQSALSGITLGGVTSTNTGQMVMNYGTISSTFEQAIDFVNTVAVNCTITNLGNISTSASGLAAIALQSGGSTIVNEGSITARFGPAIDIETGSAWAANSITNFGTISTARATTTAISLSGANDRVVNAGTINGIVGMGNGNDTYDGRGGQVTGTVQGGLGNDTYRINDAKTDLIEFGNGGTDRVLAGISYTLQAEFETLQLLGSAVRGTGNAAANTLYGGQVDNVLLGRGGDDLLTAFQGEDALFGGAGDDTLIGGVDVDNLTGGSGEDVFRFHAELESTLSDMDTINGFIRNVDVIDLSFLDGNTAASGSQNFTFRAAGGFTAAAQVRIFDLGTDIRVLINLDADASAEMAILVRNVTTLSATDFLL